MEKIDILKFKLKEKEDILKSFKLDTFMLNEKISQVINEIDNLKTQIKLLEEEE